MRSSNQNISNKNIELEIYKTFEQFKKNKNVTIAKYLKNFDTSIFEQKKYRKIKYPYETLVKLVLFQKLKGIKFHTKLTKYLRRNPKDKYRLGFSETPNRRQIGYFINNILNDEIKGQIDFAISKINEISEKFGILLDVKTFQPEKPKKETKDRNQRLQKNVKTKDICRVFNRRFTPFINLHMGKNVVYHKKDFINLLIDLGLNQNFAETGSRIFKTKYGCCPDADTLLYHLKKYSDINEIQRIYETLFEIVWEMARQANIFDIRKSVDIAIDYTEWFYWGNRKAPMVVGKMPERGTDSCYKFITLNIVDNGKRFTLLALPVGSLNTKEELLTKLIYYAKKRIRINKVYLDRGFFDSKSIRVLNGFGLHWLMPGQMNVLIRKTMELSPSPSVITGFVMKNSRFNLIIANDKNGDKRVFATNMHFESNDVNLIDRLFLLYAKRWGIETSFRVMKHSFLAKTTSKNYHIRLFYFLFAVLLYNLWILADILIWLNLFGKVGEDHQIESKYFGTIFIMIDPGE
jgi:hypothetical protein